MPPLSPAAIYEERLSARRAVVVQESARLDRLSYARLAAFLAGLVLAGLSFGAELFSPWFALIPVVVFLYFVVRFEMARGRKSWAERAAAFYFGRLARLAGKPSGMGDGARFSDHEHPYADDLDLFGAGSVFERLTACRTRIGEDTLAAWLLAPAGPAEVQARQQAVRDLTARLDLRESIAVAGADVPAVDYQPLADWGSLPSPARGEGSEPTAWKWWAVEILGWVNIAAWVGWLFVGTTALPVLIFGIASIALAAPLVPWARRVLGPLERAERDLSLLESVLALLEREQFAAPRLRELQAAMIVDGRRASSQVSELRHLLHWFDSRRNPFFLPVAILRMWDIRYALKLEAWRGRSGPAVTRWLRALGDAEALSSLAGYAYDNPADVYPTVLPSPRWGEGGGASPQGEGSSASTVAVGLGHPLIAREKCVLNDVTLGGANGPRVLIVSGSNMSGKSTLLRAVGVNVVLALAGGAVRATSLTLTPVSLGATMRVQDSLQAGRSRFFAEVTKVRLLLDIASSGGPPLVFLLDELFSGTNSADRVAGAEGVIRALVAAGAVGFVTTHDLSLTAVAERLTGAINVHFRDDFTTGELHFEYMMRPGVVEHGNGLALMRAVGLKV
jgi:MutS-like protein